MSNNYTLEIISHHHQFAGKSLKQYYVEGINTVGAWGNEPFEIRFRNNTSQKIQVKLSLDGTDIMTGKPADTLPSDKMWVVNGYATLSLKAWPEDNNGGAAFVFTSADNSVAVHTHGDLSSRGIIAAAVFVEGHQPEPIRTVLNNPYYWWYNPYIYTYPYNTLTSQSTLPITVSNNTSWGGSLSCDKIGGAGGVGSSVGTISQNCFLNSNGQNVVSADASNEQTLGELVSVGAGQYVDQKISYVSGLIKPIFTEAVRVRFVWYDDLVKLLREYNVPSPHPSGFPGNKECGINLGGTPRLENIGRIEQPQVVYSRF